MIGNWGQYTWLLAPFNYQMLADVLHDCWMPFETLKPWIWAAGVWPGLRISIETLKRCHDYLGCIGFEPIPALWNGHGKSPGYAEVHSFVKRLRHQALARCGFLSKGRPKVDFSNKVGDVMDRELGFRPTFSSFFQLITLDLQGLDYSSTETSWNFQFVDSANPALMLQSFPFFF